VYYYPAEKGLVNAFPDTYVGYISDSLGDRKHWFKTEKACKDSLLINAFFSYKAIPLLSNATVDTRRRKFIEKHSINRYDVTTCILNTNHLPIFNLTNRSSNRVMINSILQNTAENDKKIDMKLFCLNKK
jgi:hypothetical protein